MSKQVLIILQVEKLHEIDGDEMPLLTESFL